MAHTILLADDSVTIRKVVELTFSDEDFTIIAVGDGAKALERARAERPDIVISDVIMPGLNGYELCQRLKGDPALRGIPFLFLKGTFEGFDEERARACGADGFIVKPFEAQELVGKVKELIAASSAAAKASAGAAPVTHAATLPQPATPQRAEAFDFDFGDEFALPRQVEDAAAAKPLSKALPPEPDAEGGEDLWSEVSLQGRGTDVLLAPAAPSVSHDWGEPAAAGDLEEPSGLIDDEAIFDEIPTGGVSAPLPVVAAPAATPAIPPLGPAGAPLHAGIDAAEIERIVAARLEAAVRQALDPLVGDLARRTVEAIAWEVIPDLAESMIRAEIERVRRAAGTD
jgi:CheY-like chemotaxis protein